MFRLNGTARPAAATEQDLHRLKSDIHRLLVDSIDVSRLHQWKPERLRKEVHDLAADLARQHRLAVGADGYDRLVGELMDEVFGLGPLQPLTADPDVTEILVNGPDKVYVERAGRLHPTSIRFADNDHVVRLVQRIAARVGRRIDESSPLLDARLEDGSRVNATLPPVTVDGAMLSIRRFSHGFTADKLVQIGSMSAAMHEFLRAIVEARVNVLVSGGSGAGKTTFLNALSAHIPADERVVTIEDTLELRLRQPHVVRMESRPPNLEGKGEIPPRSLVRNALRMRPDRIIVGECRGAEALDMLQAMNTGHDGSLTTVHANDTRDALSRLEVMVGIGGLEVPVPVLRGYISKAIQVVVHLSRLKGGARRVTRVSEMLGLSKTGRYTVRDIFRYDQTGVEDGHAVGGFSAAGYVPRVTARLAAAGVRLPDSLFAAAGPAEAAR